MYNGVEPVLTHASCVLHMLASVKSVKTESNKHGRIGPNWTRRSLYERCCSFLDFFCIGVLRRYDTEYRGVRHDRIFCLHFIHLYSGDGDPLQNRLDLTVLHFPGYGTVLTVP